MKAENRALCGLVVILCLLFAACTDRSPGPVSNSTDVETSEAQGASTAQESSKLGVFEQPDAVAMELLAQLDAFSIVVDHASGALLVLKAGEQLDPDSLASDHPVSIFLNHRQQAETDAAFTAPPDSSFIRIDATSGTVSVAGLEEPVPAQALEGGYLADAWMIKSSADGVWIQQEELVSEQVEVKGEDVFRINVAASVRHFDTQGTLLQEATVYLKKPRGHRRYFSINSRDEVYFLAYNGGKSRIQVRRLTLRSPGDFQLPTEREPLPLPAEVDNVESFEDVVRAQSADDAMLTLPTTSRAQIMQQAEQILNTTWTLTEAGYADARVNHCDVPETIWRRPEKLQKAQIGSSVMGPPYKWGGNLPLGKFRDAIESGAVGGDVCTCRCRKTSGCTATDWCIDPKAAGFDCSGFVSNAWGIPYHSTSTLHKVSTPIQWQALKPGDILNSPGKHVRLFERFEGEDALKFIAMESSVGCSGVCRKTFTVSELVGYIPYRLETLTD